MLQHCPTLVTTCSGFSNIVSRGEGMDQDWQKPRQAFVVIENSTQSGMLIFLVSPLRVSYYIETYFFKSRPFPEWVPRIQANSPIALFSNLNVWRSVWQFPMSLSNSDPSGLYPGSVFWPFSKAVFHTEHALYSYMTRHWLSVSCIALIADGYPLLRALLTVLVFLIHIIY